MTPDRRLDQLEPLMADSLQKIDRLIEGQGQLVELATSTKAELDQVKEAGEVTARAVANLTVSTQRQFEELKTGQEQLIANQESLNVSQDQLNLNYQELKGGQVQLNLNYQELKGGQQQLNLNYQELKGGQQQLNLNYEELKGGQEELRKNQEILKAGQEAIMNYLREKLP